jgi:hypothetical protein
MTNRPPLRFWIDGALGVFSTVMLVMTVTMPDWIERIWGLDPDGGDGSVEWGLTIFMVVAALAFFADAHRVRSRSAATSARTP